MANTLNKKTEGTKPKLKELSAEEALREKAKALAEKYPLNPGGVSSDIDPVPQPVRSAKVYPDGKLNPGGLRNPSN